MADIDPAAEPPAPPRAKPGSEPIDTRLVRRLADILKDTDLTEIEVERGDLKIRVSRAVTMVAGGAGVGQPQFAPPHFNPAQPGQAPSGHGPAATSAIDPAAGLTTDTGPAHRGDLIKSPMVGTAYLQAQPGSPPFVRVGDRVSEGQTLLIIEAMKTMNPIPSPKSGVVVEIVVEDAQPVEYGEPLVIID